MSEDIKTKIKKIVADQSLIEEENQMKQVKNR